MVKVIHWCAMQTEAIPLDSLVACYRNDPVMTPQKWVLWAADCADHVLHIFEARYLSDTRPALAIAAARAWIANPTEENRQAAARAARAAYAAYAAARAAYAAADAAYATAYAAADAAADAAAAAARAAARAATYAADAAADAAYAAAAAARAAAADAADADADAAADAAAERLWQSVRLMEIYHA